MTPPRGIHVHRTAVGEHWRHVGRARALAAGYMLAAVALVLVGVAARSTVAPFTGEVALGCLASGIVAVVLGIRVLRSGIVLDAHGVTGRGMVVTRRLRWEEVVRFLPGVEELAPNKPAAVVRARLRSGRLVTLPGTRVEGWTWNLDRHRRIAAAVAEALEQRRRTAAQS